MGAGLFACPRPIVIMMRICRGNQLKQRHCVFRSPLGFVALQRRESIEARRPTSEFPASSFEPPDLPPRLLGATLHIVLQAAPIHRGANRKTAPQIS